MINRLQFVHHGDGNEGIFKTREEAIAYVTGNSVVNTAFKITGDTGADNAIDWLPLYAEPMVLEYGDKENPNVILAIGSKGDGRTPSTQNKVFFIDIEGVNERVDNAYKEIADAVKKFAFVTKNSNTLELTKTTSTDGTENILSGSVKIADNVILNRKEVGNIIKENKDGLYSYVGMTYDNDKKVLKFQVNDNETDISLPTIEDGYYDITKEALIFKYADGRELKVDMDDLIDEWTTEGESSKTPIVLTRDRHSDTGVVDNDRRSGKWKDVLKADVRIAPKEMGVDNILKTIGDGKYLYVSGQAKNISYYDKTGKKTNVQDALDSLKTPISNDPTNLLQWKYGSDNVIDGLYAGIDIEYDDKTNTITFINTSSDSKNKKQSFKLNSASFINRIYTDTVNEKVILEYYNQKGELQTADIDLSHLVDEWVVNNEAHSVELKKQTNYPGADILTADVKIYNDINDNNAIKEVGSEHGLFVDRRASNIKYNKDGVNTDAQKELDSINKTLNKLNKNANVNVGETSTVQLTKNETVDGFKITGDVKLNRDNNLVIETNTGLLATIDYDATKNELIVSDSTNASRVRRIPLATSKIVKKAEYKAETEELVLVFDDIESKNGETVSIPMSGLITEWETSQTENQNHTVELNRTRVINGKYVLTADVHIVRHKDDNILTQVEEDGVQKLYVSSQKIKENKDAIDGLKNELAVVKTKSETNDNSIDILSGQVGTNTASLTSLKTKVDTNTNDVTTLKGKVDTINNHIQYHETALTSLNRDIQENSTKIKNLEGKLSNVANQQNLNTNSIERFRDKFNFIGNDIINLKANDEKLDTKITKVSDDLKDAIKNGKYAFKSENSTIKFNVSKDNIDTTTNVVNAQVLPSTASDNIIKISNNADGAGVYASINLRYDSGTNSLKWKTSAMNEEQTITLNAGSVIKGMVYDKDNKSLVITYEVDVEGRKTTNNITVPVMDLFNEWDVKNYETNSAIKLVRNDRDMVSADNHTDILSARVILAGEGNDVDHADNLLTISNNGLYVGGDKVRNFIKKETNDVSETLKNNIKTIGKIVTGKDNVTDGDNYQGLNAGTTNEILQNATSLVDADRKLADELKAVKDNINNLYNGSDTYSSRVSAKKDNGSNVNKLAVDVRLAHYNGTHGSEGQSDTGNENVEVQNTSEIGDDYNLIKIVHVRDSKENAESNGLYFDGSIDYGTF